MASTIITTQDEADLLAGRYERRERPADPGDFRFDIQLNPEPDDPSNLYFVRMIDDRGKVVDSYTSDDPYAAVEAFRETQIYSLEERWEMRAEREAYDRAMGI